jgi:hypothetical protein
MSQTDKLTPEEERQLEQYREKWFKIGCSTTPADRWRAEAAISAMYMKVGYDPPKFIWADSPLDACRHIFMMKKGAEAIPVEDVMYCRNSLDKDLPFGLATRNMHVSLLDPLVRSCVDVCRAIKDTALIKANVAPCWGSDMDADLSRAVSGARFGYIYTALWAWLFDTSVTIGASITESLRQNMSIFPTHSGNDWPGGKVSTFLWPRVGMPMVACRDSIRDGMRDIQIGLYKDMPKALFTYGIDDDLSRGMYAAVNTQIDDIMNINSIKAIIPGYVSAQNDFYFSSPKCLQDYAAANWSRTSLLQLWNTVHNNLRLEDIRSDFISSRIVPKWSFDDWGDGKWLDQIEDILWPSIGNPFSNSVETLRDATILQPVKYPLESVRHVIGHQDLPTSAKKYTTWRSLDAYLWDITKYELPLLYYNVWGSLGSTLLDTLHGTVSSIKDTLFQNTEELWENGISDISGHTHGVLWSRLLGPLQASCFGLGNSTLNSIRNDLGRERREAYDSLRSYYGTRLREHVQIHPSNLHVYLDSITTLLAYLANAGVAIRETLRTNFQEKLDKIPKEEIQEEFSKILGECWWGQQESYWIAFYKFAEEVLGVKYEKEEDLELWSQIAQSCGWWWPYKDVCIISERPKEVNWETTRAQPRLHKDDGPAINFRDGYSVWCLEGMLLDKKIVETPHELTIEEIDKEENVERRRVMLERYGIERYLKESGTEFVCQDRFGKLYRREFNNDEDLVVVRVTNSTPEPDGTIKDYFLRVPSEMKTPQEAVAWTFDVLPENYLPFKET